ncbi:MAG: hypothetical protein JWQ89_300 [Devosia sp.]|uniref:hypothetical protein n=1 Tax=Devosia sp. TaxID=1871048 RepID=UPI00260C3EE6|nr:hypothetical protein [Devosia sp.]MDB5538573.1 hypothetical protein [Devosia sp.]
MKRRQLFAGAAAAVACSAPIVAVAGLSPSAPRPESRGDKLQAFLDTADAADLIQYHASQLAAALCKERPGVWRFSLEHIHQQGNFVMFHYDQRQHGGTFNGYTQDFF